MTRWNGEPMERQASLSDNRRIGSSKCGNGDEEADVGNHIRILAFLTFRIIC